MALVTLATAKAHLQIPSTTIDGDAEIGRKVEQASATVLAMMTPTLASAWTVDTVPDAVVAQILIVLGFLYGNRGDDVDGLKADPRPDVMRELMRLGYRDPALA